MIACAVIVESTTVAEQISWLLHRPCRIVLQVSTMYLSLIVPNSALCMAQAVREFEAQLADRAEEAQAQGREHENLEGQVEQLTICLMDANSKKTDSELRLRQFQQVRC